MTKKYQTILTLILTFISSSAFSQDTLYYKKFDSSVNDSVDVYEVFVADTGIGGCISIYDLNDNILTQNCYSDYSKKIEGGPSKIWYKNSQLKESRKYQQGILIDTFSTYWSNGQLRREEIYESNIKVKKRCLDSLGTEVVFFDYLVMPHYSSQSISHYIRRNFPHIPEYESEECGYSSLKVSFVVKKDGSLSDVKVINAHCIWDKKIIEMVEGMPHWTPCKIENEPADIRVVLPIRYVIE